MIDRSVAPLPSESIKFDIPEIKVISLESGIKIYHVQRNKLPIVHAIITSDSGSYNDPEDKKGLAFLTSLLIDEGAAEYDALQLNNEIKKLGTLSNININHDSFTFSILSLKEHFERSFELISKIILQPHFNELEFAREKKKVLDKILQLQDDPSYIASSVFERRIFLDTPYGFPEIGFENTVNLISNRDVQYFYKNNFINSDFKIVVVGNIDETEIISLCRKYLSSLNSTCITTNKLELQNTHQIKIYFVDKKESAQSEIRIGHITKGRKSPDFYAARIMNTILGGQFSSRINMNLRERRGFTYGAGSSINYHKNAGYFLVSTAVNIQNTGEALREIFDELNSIRNRIEDSEIEFAKSYLVREFPSRFETYSQIANYITPLLKHSLPIDYYQNYTSNIAKVTKEEITQSANEYVNPERMIVVVVGDKKEIEPQLKKVFASEPIELNLNGNFH